MHNFGNTPALQGLLSSCVTLNLCSSADESMLESTPSPVDVLGGVPKTTGSSTSALPDSHYAALKSPASPGALLSIPEPVPKARTANSQHSESESSKSLVPRNAYVKDTGVRTSPSLSPTTTSSTKDRGVRTNTDKQEYNFSLYSMRWKPLPESNASVTTLSPSALSESTPHRDLDYKEETTSRMAQNGRSAQTQSAIISADNSPLTPPELALTDDPDGHNEVSSKPEQGPNTMPSLDQIMAPGYHVPFTTPQSSLILSEPDQVPSEDFYPTNTMDVDWGSGDYLETMSFFNAGNDDYSLVTKVLPDPYEMEDDTEIYDTSFPSRVGISPSSRLPGYDSPTSSLMTSFLAVAPHPSVHPSSFPTKVPAPPRPTPPPGTEVPDVSDEDWGDVFTIRPTDVLLPDMNSLEYYTTQLTKDGGAEHRMNVTEVSFNATTAPATTNFTTDADLMEAEPSIDLSVFGPRYEATETTPELTNTSEPFLDPSIVPTFILDPSSSVWGGSVSTTVWSTQTLTPDVDSALVDVLQPSSAPLLPEDVVSSSSSLTDVHWFVTEPFDEDSRTLITPLITATVAFSPDPAEAPENSTAVTTEPTSHDLSATQQTADTTPVSNESRSHNATLVPPVMFGDQSVTDEGADNISTMTSIPTSGEVITVPVATTNPPATNTPHQATAGSSSGAETSTNVSITATTSKTTTPASATSRQYLCKVDSPAYLTKTGKSDVHFHPACL